MARADGQYKVRGAVNYILYQMVHSLQVMTISELLPCAFSSEDLTEGQTT